MSPSIQEFINCKRLAVVGVSRNSRKFGNAAFKELSERGYQVFAVHPEEKEIAGVTCFPNLTSLKDRVDGVVVSIPSKHVVPVLEEAASINLKNVWLQQGAESKEVIASAERLGLHFVSGKCILMYALPVKSVHRIHRGIMKFFGRL